MDNELKKFYIDEYNYLDYLEEVIKNSKRDLEQKPCIIDNSYNWELVYGYVLAHLNYLIKKGLCSKELKSWNKKIKKLV
mgnify:CR=1 FL=1